MREPDRLGVERPHPQLAFGVRLVEFAKPNRHVTANDDRAPARLVEDRNTGAPSQRRLTPVSVCRKRGVVLK